MSKKLNKRFEFLLCKEDQERLNKVMEKIGGENSHQLRTIINFGINQIERRLADKFTIITTPTNKGYSIIEFVKIIKGGKNDNK